MSKFVRKYGAAGSALVAAGVRKCGAAGALVAAGAANAQATLPAGVEDAISDASDMLVAGATAVIVAMVAFWALRKLGSKMGWW